MAAAIAEKRLRAIPLEVGSSRWVVENVETGTNYTVNTMKGECTCPDWQYRRSHKREDCCHIAEVRTVIERQRHYREKMPIQTARAIEEVTGEKQVPLVAGMTDAELRVVFA